MHIEKHKQSVSESVSHIQELNQQSKNTDFLISCILLLKFFYVFLALVSVHPIYNVRK